MDHSRDRIGRRMRRLLAPMMALLVVLPALVALTPTPAVAAPATRMRVTVMTPKGVPANVVLTGAGRIVVAKPAAGASSRITQTVRAGTYRVAVPTSTIGGVRYVGVPSPRTVRVRAGRTTAVRVKVSAEPGARALSAATPEQTSVALSWAAGNSTTFSLRRSSGSTAPASRTRGTAVKVNGRTAVDRGLTADTTYSYALFSRVRSRWYGPQTITVRTASAAGGAQAAFVARPTTVFAPASTPVSGTASQVTVALGAAAPVLGSAVVLPPSAQLAGGYIGVVSAVAPDGAVILTPGGVGDALERYSLSSPAFTSDPVALPAARVRSALATMGRQADRAAPQRRAPATSSALACDGGASDVRVGVEPRLGIGGAFDLQGDMAAQRATVDIQVVVGGSAVLGASVARRATCALQLPKVAKTVVVGGIPIGFALTPVVRATVSGRVNATGVGAVLQAGFAVHGTMAVRDGRIAMTADPRPITSFTQQSPSVDGRVDIGLRLGGELLVGPGVASEVGGALAGVQGSIDVVNGVYALAAGASGAGPAACMRVSAGFSAGLYLVAKAWLHVPLAGFDLNAQIKLAGLDQPIPYFAPVSVPAGCDPDAVPAGSGSPGGGAPAPAPSSPPTTAPPTGAVAFADSGLKQCVLAAYATERGVTLADITPAQLATLRTLDCERRFTVTDLSGLQYATGLTTISMMNDAQGTPEVLPPVTHLSALSGLSNLRTLVLGRVSDLAPLTGLTGLTTLRVAYGSFTSLAPVAALKNLQDLNLYTGDQNSAEAPGGFRDLSPVLGLTSLRHLALGTPLVCDWSPLAPLVARGVEVGASTFRRLPPATARVPYLLPKCLSPSGAAPTLSILGDGGAITTTRGSITNNAVTWTPGNGWSGTGQIASGPFQGNVGPYYVHFLQQVEG